MLGYNCVVDWIYHDISLGKIKRQDVKKAIDPVVNEINKSTSISIVNLKDYFHILGLKKAFVDEEIESINTIAYVSNLMFEFAVNRQLTRNHDFTDYESDISSKISRTDSSSNRYYGDSFFFNLVAVSDYHIAKRKPIGLDYYRNNAKEHYGNVINFSDNQELLLIFTGILNYFDIFEETYRKLHSDFILRTPDPFNHNSKIYVPNEIFNKRSTSIYGNERTKTINYSNNKKEFQRITIKPN